MDKHVLVTDIDNTMIKNPDDLYVVKPWVEKLVALGFTLVFNTAKTIDELLYILETLELDLDKVILIPENGGAVCSSRYPVPGLPLYEYNGLNCSVLSLITPEIDALLDHSVKLCESARRISKASTAELASILNLPGRLARLAGHRLFNDAIYVGDEECITLLEGFLTGKGLSTVRHGSLIYAGISISKKKALEALLKTPWFKYSVLIGIGDSVIDDFLELTSHPIIVGYNGGWLRKWHTRIPYEPPYGWIWSIEKSLLI